MASMESEVAALEQRREELNRQLAQIGEMRPGSLVKRYRKCGKPNCRCARPGERGHGPSFSLTRQVEGKTVTRVIPAGAAVERTRAQIAEYRRFRRLVVELVEVSERLCQARLEAERKGAAQPVKKKPSEPASGKK